jgi:histidinol-phosphate/aromatic aminotransferase/cobyric acid decarboxylase-like protein
MLSALREAALGRYPDSSALEARSALAALAGVSADEITLGNGAAELLWTLARTLLEPDARALMVEPTFSEFRAAASCCGAGVAEWRSRAEAGFGVDLGALSECLRTARARVVYLCSPNTPTGTALPAAGVADWAARHPELWLVLDQSFLSLSERFMDAAVAMPSNVVRVRSLTKDHGIPGVRVGYLIAAPELCRAVENNRPQWSTSAFAQAAAIAACRSLAFVAESRERLIADRRALTADLASLGIETLPSCTTYCLARVGDASLLRERLLSRHGILVRDCSSFGLPGFLRLAAKPPEERARLVAALQAEASCSPRR